jgi:DNA-3-methyladenine glycosylase
MSPTKPKRIVRLKAGFYSYSTLELARRLLGKRLVRRLDGVRLSGRIVEVEAYIREDDLACHARFGRTARNAVMYGPPGHAYVYFTYGMHWMLNVVAEREGFPAAVLIRALEPLEGIETMQRNRGLEKIQDLCRGPARLTQALGIDRALNGANLCASDSGLWIEDALPVDEASIATGPRIGLNNTPEPWLSTPWRFYVAGSPFVSRRQHSGHG